MKEHKITDKELFETDNYMVIGLSGAYGEFIILPYKDGITLISAFSNAESVKGSIYDLREGKPIKFAGHAALNAEIITLSKAEYRRLKMNALLGLDEEKEDEWN